jgi:hypothetical protein
MRAHRGRRGVRHAADSYGDGMLAVMRVDQAAGDKQRYICAFSVRLRAQAHPASTSRSRDRCPNRGCPTARRDSCAVVAERASGTARSEDATPHSKCARSMRTNHVLRISEPGALAAAQSCARESDAWVQAGAALPRWTATSACRGWVGVVASASSPPRSSASRSSRGLRRGTSRCCRSSRSLTSRAYAAIDRCCRRRCGASTLEFRVAWLSLGSIGLAGR